MLSRISSSSAAFLFPYDALSVSESSFQVDRQILTELKQAAEQGMVSTRSQDNTPAGGAAQASKLLYPQVVVHVQKRKTGNTGEESPAQPMTKRRRRSASSNGDAARPRNKGSPKTTNGDVAHTIDNNESDQKSSSQGSRPTSPQTPRIITEQTLDSDKEDKAVEVAVNKPNHIEDLDNEVLDVNNRAMLGAEDSTGSRKGRAKKKKTKGLEGTAIVGKDGADVIAIGRKPETSSVTPAKATHKRFGSEDIEVPGTITSTGIEDWDEGQEDVSEDENESGDEAPETVTASAGFDKARTSVLEAAKGAARQKTEKKLKRREHDHRLRLQAKSAKDSQYNDKLSAKSRRAKGSSAKVSEVDEGSKSADEPPNIVRDEDQKTPAKSKTPGKTPLPLLLPEEILAAQPVIHAPTPPLSNGKPAISQKRKFLDLESKPPKDIKRGNIIISVLQDNRSILPPKHSQASKSLRESWLTGRRGLKGEIAVPRRKISGGFVRKK